MNTIGKHGEFKPRVCVDGSPIQPHYAKRGVGDGYYVIVPNKKIDILDDLLADVDKFLKTSTRKVKSVTQPESDNNDA